MVTIHPFFYNRGVFDINKAVIDKDVKKLLDYHSIPEKVTKITLTPLPVAAPVIIKEPTPVIEKEPIITPPPTAKVKEKSQREKLLQLAKKTKPVIQEEEDILIQELEEEKKKVAPIATIPIKAAVPKRPREEPSTAEIEKRIKHEYELTLKVKELEHQLATERATLLAQSKLQEEKESSEMAIKKLREELEKREVEKVVVVTPPPPKEEEISKKRKLEEILEQQKVIEETTRARLDLERQKLEAEKRAFEEAAKLERQRQEFEADKRAFEEKTRLDVERAKLASEMSLERQKLEYERKALEDKMKFELERQKLDFERKMFEEAKKKAAETPPTPVFIKREEFVPTPSRLFLSPTLVTTIPEPTRKVDIDIPEDLRSFTELFGSAINIERALLILEEDINNWKTLFPREPIWFVNWKNNPESLAEYSDRFKQRIIDTNVIKAQDKIDRFVKYAKGKSNIDVDNKWTETIGSKISGRVSFEIAREIISSLKKRLFI